MINNSNIMKMIKEYKETTEEYILIKRRLSKRGAFLNIKDELLEMRGAELGGAEFSDEFKELISNQNICLGDLLEDFGNSKDISMLIGGHSELEQMQSNADALIKRYDKIGELGNIKSLLKRKNSLLELARILNRLEKHCVQLSERYTLSFDDLLKI